MNRTATYKTPQFAISLVGCWLVIVGLIGWPADTISGPVDSPQAGDDTVLQVLPGTRQPSSTIDELQGAQGLQGQAPARLHQPDVAEQLQPNAKTDSVETGSGGVQ